MARLFFAYRTNALMLQCWVRLSSSACAVMYCGYTVCPRAKVN